MKHSNAKPKHTPGPWKCIVQNRVGSYHMGRDIGEGLNKTVISTDEAIANSKLISAAPELLEALEALLELINPTESNIDALKAAVDAVKKARGEK